MLYAQLQQNDEAQGNGGPNRGPKPMEESEWVHAESIFQRHW